MGLAAQPGMLQIVANFLSVITIAICFISKVPQILTIIKVKNARGINLIGLVMELASYTIMFSYNYRNGYALLTYMEYPVILLQQLLLILIVVHFKDYLNAYAVIAAGMYFTYAGCFMFGIVPMALLSYLVPMCTPIGASSKVVQLLEIVRLKNADSVSLLSWFISAFTNGTRIFTILIDSGDFSLLLNFIINTGLSSLVMCTAYYYQYVYQKPRKKID